MNLAALESQRVRTLNGWAADSLKHVEPAADSLKHDARMVVAERLSKRLLQKDLAAVGSVAIHGLAQLPNFSEQVNHDIRQTIIKAARACSSEKRH